ncbi:MAG: hypothetical protein ACTSUO_04660 [Candidatus Thorarchaeota archaeon]
MTEDEPNQVYVFCNICKENVPLEISESDVESAKSGIATVLSVHGNPQHAILVYLDKQLKVRGSEYPSLLHVADSATVDTDAALPTEDVQHDLKSIIGSFGDKQDDAISAFTQITTQIIAGNSLYLVHNNRSIGNVVKEQLDALFTDQKTALFVISNDEMDTVSGMRPVIFDLQYASFVSKGLVIDTAYFEQLVKDAQKSQNGFSVLKNEFSKLMFSYRRLWELLSSGVKKYSPKRLAYLVSIDKSLMPLLLKMAENDGVDVQSRLREWG